MSDPAEDEQLDAVLRAALGDVPELPSNLMQCTARRAHAELPRPGEGTLSLRGVAYVAESTGIAALVVLASLFYAVVEGLQIASIFGG